MPKQSAGILPFRETVLGLEVFLVHPGGPFWAKKDLGAWSLPKGEFDEEEPLAAARREFAEETGFVAAGEMIPLEPIRQPGGKTVHAWAMRANLDPAAVESQSFSMEWPPKSGRRQEFLEVDRAAWFPIDTARTKILKGQEGFINQLVKKLEKDHPPS